MTINEIPLSPDPQTLYVSLSGTTYQLRITFCDQANATSVGYSLGPYGDDGYGGVSSAQGCWIMDIYDNSANAVALGIALVPGTDLLGQLQYLGIGGSMYVQSDTQMDAPPTFTNLGVQSHLYYVTP